MKQMFLWLGSFLFSVSSFAQEAEKEKLTDYFQNEQYSEAIQYLEPKRNENQGDVSFLNSLGYAYYMNDNMGAATVCFNQSLNIASQNFTANRYKALIAVKYKAYDSALFYYNRLVQLQPSNGILHLLRGNVYRTKAATDSAFADYETAYHLLPQNSRVLSVFADMLFDKKQYATADSIINAALQRDSANTSLIKLAIQSAYEQKQYERAASYTLTWQNSGELSLSTTKQLAIANYNLQRFTDCFRICDTVLQQGVEAEALYYYAARALYKLHQFERSNALLQHCLELSISNTADAYYWALADNLEAAHNYKAAIAAYDTAYYLFKNPGALYNIGRLYESGLHNKASAIRYYKRYIHTAKPETKEEKLVYQYVKEFLKPTTK